MKLVSMFIADFDRTITDSDLNIDISCLSSIRQLKQQGVHTCLVTGRKRSFVEEFLRAHDDIFKSAICENGCIVFFEGYWHTLSENKSREQIIERLSESGVKFDYGDCIISTEELSEIDVKTLLSGITDYRIIVNIDSMMILPSGVDKGAAITWLRDNTGYANDEIAGIGDGENDIVMRDVCGIFGTPSTAVTTLKRLADFISEKSYSDGTKDFIDYLKKNYLMPAQIRSET